LKRRVAEKNRDAIEAPQADALEKENEALRKELEK
jgi:hypothetical protein